MANAFAGYPAPFIRDAPGGAKIQQLIWGDFVRLLGETDGDWRKVKSRRETGWMHEDELQPEQLLEVNFVDIGQGDGAFLVTPSDEFLLVDAGETDSMFRFLSWRFNLRFNDFDVRIPAVVISHPDQDHYKGFARLFKSPRFRFGTVYHNGIVERAGGELLGPREELDGRKYLTDVIREHAALEELLSDSDVVGTKQYPRMLKAALESGRVEDTRGLDLADGFLPGYEAGEELSIEVLAPIAETVGGKAGLRWFGTPGKTKNGHSVVLRLVYRDVRILLGGDLNVPAEEYLLGHHTGLDASSDDPDVREEVVTAARAVFESDVAKACHHGSADLTDLYLRAVHPIATVISSGDDEPHAHPRPDALGAFGKYGRGDRPLLFSTELARSARENIKDPFKLRKRISDLFQKREEAGSAEAREAVQKKIDAALSSLERSVAVYGLINLRTDGRKVLLAQKLERPRSSTREEWDVHRLEPDDEGALRYVSKH